MLHKLEPSHWFRHLPILGSLVLPNTCTKTSVDDGLLRISIACKDPVFSLIMYVDSLKVKIAAAKLHIYVSHEGTT